MNLLIVLSEKLDSSLINVDCAKCHAFDEDHEHSNIKLTKFKIHLATGIKRAAKIRLLHKRISVTVDHQKSTI